jgi:hypothetical protein
MGNLEATGLPTNPKADPTAPIPQFPFEVPSFPSLSLPFKTNKITPFTKEEHLKALHHGQSKLLGKLLSRRQTNPLELDEIVIESRYFDGIKQVPGGTRALAERLGLRYHED